jgi:hypothetical protein
MTDQIPSDATSIFLYSSRQERIRDGGRRPRCAFLDPSGSKTAYTKEIASGLDAEAEIAAYQKDFPDAHVVGYGISDTQRFTSSSPTLTNPTP